MHSNNIVLLIKFLYQYLIYLYIEIIYKIYYIFIIYFIIKIFHKKLTFKNLIFETINI